MSWIELISFYQLNQRFNRLTQSTILKFIIPLAFSKNNFHICATSMNKALNNNWWWLNE